MRLKSFAAIILFAVTAQGAVAQERITFVTHSDPDVVQPPPVVKLNRVTVAQVLRALVPQFTNRSEDALLVELGAVPKVSPESLRAKFPSYQIPETLGWTSIQPDGGGGSIVELTELGRKVFQQHPDKIVELREGVFLLMKFERAFREAGPIRDYRNGEAYATFTWVRKPTALVARAVKEEGPFKGKVHFERFDHGWEVQRIEGRIQLALQRPYK